VRCSTPALAFGEEELSLLPSTVTFTSSILWFSYFGTGVIIRIPLAIFLVTFTLRNGAWKLKPEKSRAMEPVLLITKVLLMFPGERFERFQMTDRIRLPLLLLLLLPFLALLYWQPGWLTNLLPAALLATKICSIHQQYRNTAAGGKRI
jgi:hypothetical protein